MGKLTYRDKELLEQPFHQSLESIHNFCASRNISKPFSKNGYDALLSSENLTTTMLGELADLFKGEENLRETFLQITKNDIKDYRDRKGVGKYIDAEGNTLGVEGLGSAAPASGYDYFDNLNPVMTAGYLARARSIELYHVYHNDKPTFYREYNIQTAIVDDVEYPLPQAIRDGVLGGALDLPVCQPKVTSGLTHIVEVEDPRDSRKLVMLKTGSRGNLMAEAGINKSKYALEMNASIDYIAVKFEDMKEDKPIIIKKNIGRVFKEGNLAERAFMETVQVKYINKNDETVVTSIDISARINLNTGDYIISTMGDDDPLKYIHFDIKITNTPNEMSTLMGGNHKWHISFDVENKRYATIPIIPEMIADYNAGGEGVSWVAYMTDYLTEAIAGIRNIDLENYVFDSFDLDVEEFEMYKKLGGYKTKGTFNVAQRYPGGTDDYMAPSRNALRKYMYRLFTRAEKKLQFDNDISRQWIVMGNDEDTEMFMDNPTKNDKASFGPSNGTTKNGFSNDDLYGFSDATDRRVRVIGSRDNRWIKKPLTCVLKSTALAAPTTIYFPYSVKLMSGISPEFSNRAAMIFMIRDAKRISTMAQARVTLEGNDESLYSNMSAFASGFPKSGQPD